MRPWGERAKNCLLPQVRDKRCSLSHSPWLSRPTRKIQNEQKECTDILGTDDGVKVLFDTMEKSMTRIENSKDGHTHPEQDFLATLFQTIDDYAEVFE